MLNFIAIDLQLIQLRLIQLYKIFKIARVSFFGTRCIINDRLEAYKRCSDENIPRTPDCWDTARAPSATLQPRMHREQTDRLPVLQSTKYKSTSSTAKYSQYMRNIKCAIAKVNESDEAFIIHRLLNNSHTVMHSSNYYTKRRYILMSHTLSCLTAQMCPTIMS